MKNLKYSLAIGALLLGVTFTGVPTVHAEGATTTAQTIVKDSAQETDPAQGESGKESADSENKEGKSEDSTAASDKTTAPAEETTATSEETTATSEETTATSEEPTTETKKSQSTTSKSESTTIAPKNTNLKRWLAICKSIGKNLDNNFRYSNGNPQHSYIAACKSSRKRSNCALYVSWCLQKYGVLSYGKTFYTKKSGRIHKSFKSWGSKVKIIKVNKTMSAADLKPGDILCWKGIAHTNIYAGKNSKGQYTFYDAGRRSTKKGHSGSRFSKVEYARPLSFLSGKKISYIIRIKNL